MTTLCRERRGFQLSRAGVSDAKYAVRSREIQRQLAGAQGAHAWVQPPGRAWRQLLWSAYSDGWSFRFSVSAEDDPLACSALARLWERLGIADPHGTLQQPLLEEYLDGVNYWRALAGDQLICASHPENT